MTVRDFSGSPFPKGSVLEVRMAPNGALEVVGAQHLPLRSHEWTLMLTDEDLEQLLLADSVPGHAVARDRPVPLSGLVSRSTCGGSGVRSA